MFRHHPDPALSAVHAEVEALLGRLGHDVSTLDDGGDATNRQALADASERYNTAGAQFSQAQTTEELSVVRSVAIEGLHSTRLVRTRLGLDPGPDPAEVMPVPVVAEQHAGGILGGHHLPGGLGTAIGAGAAGGLLGVLGGGILGEVLGGDDGGGEGWGRGDGWDGDDGGDGGDE